ncbi:MAG TPA: peptide chain release factor N(5)-glutamine methyltransferase [Candidatus Polarisedimenticolia bacterium]|jgi:release factor glutamine methyltransferase
MPARGSKTIGALLAEAQVRLAACGIDSARLDAEVLLGHALGVERGRLAAMLASGGGASVDEPAAAAFRGLVRRRALREPVAYITGRREFWSLDLEVTPAVLIPRPETELLVAETLASLALCAPAGRGGARVPRVADVGTGSGAVAVALAVERPDAFITATDVSREALDVARRNARRHGGASRIGLVQADLLEGIAGPFDVVASNPPYVAPEEGASLMPEVKRYEPALALFGGPDGMAVIARLVAQAADRLVPGGWLLVEIASPRGARTVEMVRGSGVWDDVTVRDDYAGLPRVVKARRRDTDGNPGPGSGAHAPKGRG